MSSFKRTNTQHWPINTQHESSTSCDRKGIICARIAFSLLAISVCKREGNSQAVYIYYSITSTDKHSRDARETDHRVSKRRNGWNKEGFILNALFFILIVSKLKALLLRGDKTAS